MELSTPFVAATYAEIALKGRNRSLFLRKLMNNIRRMLKGLPLREVLHVESRLLIELTDPSAAPEVAERLREVFGLQWVAPAVAVPRSEIDGPLAEDLAAGREPTLGPVSERAVALARADAGDARHFKVSTKRSDRSFALGTPQVNRAVGGAVHQALGLPARMSQPDYTLNVIVLKDWILLLSAKLAAYGGLPSGSSGRALLLLSGGLDSPVAGWLMMRRGLRPEMIHFYSGRSTDEADTGKIRELAATLRRFSPVPLNLWLVPAVPFEMRSIGVVPDSYDMVMFRRYMFKTAAKLARRNGCNALIAGDSLGQVASQTIHNLGAIGPDLDLPVFRPLIGMDKLEIVEWSKRIGAFDTSILPYRDCCSIRSPKPVLHARPQALLDYSERMDLDGAVDEALAAVVKIVID